jgi:tRNA threonylcarbamoyladenosine modification (KEOPS) complex  Pcc1 subunit
MKSCSEISITCSDKESDHLLLLFSAQDKELSNNRAFFTLSKSTDGVVFTITADDCVALRAIISAITKSLSIFEKTREIVQQE